TQEVAYESLLTPRRQALHGAAGRALEALYADRLEVAYDRLAYHYSKTEQAPKAVEYLTRAAEKAARSYAHTEAVTALQEALVHVEWLPIEERDRRLLDLVLRQAESLHYLGRRQAIVDFLLEHQERLERLADPSLAGPYFFRLGLTYTFLGNREETTRCAQRALQEAMRCGDKVTMGRAHRVLAMEGWCSGQLEEGAVHGRQAVSLLERTEERLWLGEANWALAWDYYWMGDFERALETAARVGAIGETIGSRRLQSEGAAMTGLSYATRGEWAAGTEVCQRAFDLSPDRYEAALSEGFLGRAYLEKGDLTEAVPVLEQAVHQANQVRSRQVQAWFAALLGEAYLLNGQIEQARDLSTKALEIATAVKFLIGVGLAQRALGRSAQTQGDLAEAQTHLNEALQTFASIRARFEVGRTHLDLAALAHAQGNREAMATHLSEAHSLFKGLRVPKYVERTEQLAKEFGVSLSEKSAR
ncbi:MAG: tetratricopeptide repeat protein, partial [Anaerolineae bacterium]